eukprot:PhF_6_TR3344/c1_g1_i1/m.4723
MDSSTGTISPSTTRRIVRFVSSLRRSGSTAEVVLFIRKALQKPLEEALGEELIAQHLHLVAVTPGWRTRVGLYLFSSLRFTLYKLFLDTYGDCFSAVMTTDVTDVVFVSDPFTACNVNDQCKDETLIAALEHKDTRISATEGINGYWIEKCFGSDVRKKFIGTQVSCSGTTIGTVHIMKRYVTEMDRVMRFGGPFCGVQGVDQGVHNVILRTVPDLANKVRFVDIEKGPILTMDGVTSLRFDDRRRVVNEHGVPYSVLHQVNRCNDFLLEVVEAGGNGAAQAVSPGKDRNMVCSLFDDPPLRWWKIDT